MITLIAAVASDQAFERLKDIAETASALLAIGAALVAAKTYASNAQRERAKWAVQLYEKFYESDRYKLMREELDCEPDEDAVVQHVREESAIFTDYLNFFELVAFLANSKQLSERDVLQLFQYYLHCLEKHAVVSRYINDEHKGFEMLSALLRKTSV